MFSIASERAAAASAIAGSKADDTDTGKALTHVDFLRPTMGIAGGEWRQKHGENEGREARNVAQAWRSARGTTLLVLCKSLMEMEPALGFEPRTA